YAQGPINVKRTGTRLGLQSLAQDNLKDVARLNVLLAFLNRRLESPRFKVGTIGTMHLANRGDVRQLQIRHALLEALDQAIDAGTGRVIASAQVMAVNVRVRHNCHGLGYVVENDHAVVERETEVGQTAVIEGRMRQMLDVSNGVVTRITHRPTTEA